MKIIPNRFLIWYTVATSVVCHFIVLFLIPSLISGSSYAYTLRDLTFLVEEVIQTQKKSYQDGKVKVEPALSAGKSVNRLSRQESIPPTNDSLLDRSAQEIAPKTTQAEPLNKSGIIPGFNKKQAEKDFVSKSKSGLTIQETQAKLKELEQEIGNLSDEERLARLPKQKRYLTQVREQLLQHYYIPRKAKYHKMTGQVILQITVHRSGRLMNIKILKHSDFPVLDIAATGSVKAAAPFPDISDKVDFPHINIIVTFRYK